MSSEMVPQISKIETKRYEKLKAQIHSWWNDRLAIGAALIEIRDDQLYKHEYPTFEAFCQSEYEFTARQAYRLIEAAEVKASLEMRPIGSQLTNERQARALAAVPEEQREEVLETAAETGKVTAKSITEAAQKVTSPKPEKVIHLDKTGWPIPDSVYPDWQEAESLKSLVSDLQHVKLTVETAIKNSDLSFRELTNTTVAALKNAWMDLSRVLPYAVCPTCQGHNRQDCTLCKKRGFISKFGYDAWVPQELKDIREKGK